MKSLKDLIASDVESLFFNLDEFAEAHWIEGKNVDIVVDGDRLEDRKQGANLGIAEAEILFFGRSSDLEFVPRKAPGSLLRYDNRECIIVDWTENMGVAQVAIRQNRTI